MASPGTGGLALSAGWESIRTLFGQALALPFSDRASFLDNACSDPSVRAEIDALLASHQSAPDYLDGLAERILSPALSEVGTDQSGVLELGAHVAQYRIDGLLGRGGMGVVLKAWDTRLDRPVALKFLPSRLATDDGAARRLLAEARAAAVDHPRIAVVYEVGESDAGQLFIAMAYVEGRTLRERLEAGPLPVDEAVDLARQIAEGLGAAHARGLVHRDVKPSNVLVTPRGEVKLVDFGIARAVDADLSIDGLTAGTFAYMSPEQTRGEAVDLRSDLWSLGVVFYEMLTGERPLRGEDDHALIRAIRHDTPIPVEQRRADVAESIAKVVARCLQKEPRLRHASAEEFVADLDTAQALAVVESGGPELAEAARNRLAVLPLANFVADPDGAYFADGMTEEIIGRLSRLDGLRVIARSSVIPYRDTPKSAAQIGRELGVETLLEGSVRKTGTQVRIAVRLVDARTQEQYWSASYDAEVDDVLMVQARIAEEVAASLNVQMGRRERRRVTKRGTRDPEAYDHYLKGRYLLTKWEPDPLVKARDHFQRALDLDPTFAEAWAGVADVCVVLAYLALLTPEETYTRGRAAAERSLSLDDELADAHSALASILVDYFWDWKAAEKHFRRAIDLDPSYALAHQYLAECLRDQGRFDEALVAVRQAQALDPLSPYAVLIEGTVLWLGRRYDAALARLRNLLKVHGAYPPAHVFMGLVYLDTGQFDEALEAFDRGDPDRTLPDAVGARGVAHARMGRRADAEAVLQELDALADQRYVSPFLHALVHDALGDRERVFAHLERACDERSWFMRLFKVLPALDPLRSDPRFAVLLQKVGLS